METLKTFKFKKGEKERFRSIIWHASQEALKNMLDNSDNYEKMCDWYYACLGLNTIGWMLCGDDVQEEDTIEECAKTHAGFFYADSE